MNRIAKTFKDLKAPSLLQKIARQRNWIKGRILRKISISSYTHLELSTRTQSLINNANYYIDKAQESLDKDWKKQRAKIKEDLKLAQKV